MDRWVELDGVVNMRDLGGLPTHGGGSIQPRRLLRSDNLQDLTERDIRRMVGDLGVSDIVDLRSELELSTEGPGPLRTVETLRHHHHSLFGERGKTVTAEQALALTSPREGAVRDASYWAGHYLNYVRNRPDSISAALDIVANGTGAVVVHCAAGKDRTGTLVAMALDVAGVPHDHIVADYALSSQRTEQIIARLITRDLYAAALRSQRPGEQASHPESMALILSTLADEFGGTAGWLRQHGWSAEQVEALRNRLTHA